MTAKELIKELKKFNEDSVVILGDGSGGWSNIEKLVYSGPSTLIEPELYPVFSDN